MPDVPNDWFCTYRVWIEPHRQAAGSAPSFFVSSAVAAVIASARMSSRVSTFGVDFTSHHGESGWLNRFVTTSHHRSPPFGFRPAGSSSKVLLSNWRQTALKY